MKCFFTFAVCCVIVQTGLFATQKWGGVNSSISVEMQSPCDDIQALFVPSKFYSEPGEEVTFTNQSSNYHYCFWYMDNVLVSTTNNWSYTFTADGHHDIRLEVKDENETCTAVYELEHHVHSPIHFCGDLEQPDQDPSECPCMTSFDMNEAGEMEAKTYYRWRDRWGNKYCNLSVNGDCEDNMPFRSAPVPTPTPTLCDAGYFKLYFYEIVQGGVSYPTQAQKDIICQAFKDISVLLTPVNPNTVVNFKINGVFDPNTGTLASAGSYYDVMELNVLSNAIVHGSVWKAINTNSSDPNIFHGLVNVNGAKNFYTGYAHGGIAASQFDLYGIMQHEILHALGFASLITSYGGSSFYQQNNLFSSFDEHLMNNGTQVLTEVGAGNYTFNSLGNNCGMVKFNNISSPNSPVNSSLNGAFYSPSHFDDNCTNISITPLQAINPLYVMNPSIANGQARRLQQEEVNALCKMGFVISGNYGYPTLSQGGGVNPNIRTYTCISSGGSGPSLITSNDDFFDYGDFYPSSCSNLYTGPYPINVLNNDIYPQGMGVVITDLINLQTNLPVDAVDLLPNGFNFIPTNSGIHQFSYRLYHPDSQTYSYIAIVSIYVTSCGLIGCEYPPSGCNLISNYEFERDPCEYLVNITNNYNHPTLSFPCWRSVFGTCDFYCGPNSIPFYSQLSPTTINEGGAISRAVVSYSNGIYGESFGQDLTLNPNGKYLASFYFRRKPVNYNPQNNNNEFKLQLEYADQALLPLTNNTPITPAQSVIYETELVTIAEHGVWKQAVNTFINPLSSGNIIILGPSYSTEQNPEPGVPLIHIWYEFDRVEIIEDNFTAGPDQYILCNQSAVLSTPCMEITNLQYAWYELDNFGNEVGAPIALNADVVVNPTTTTSYRLKRYIANFNDSGNNGYSVENASSLYAEDDMTVFVQLPSGNCEFSPSPNPNNCGILFTSNNPFGEHFWDFGDGTTSTEVNPIHTFSSNGSYTVTHTITEFGCECSFEQTILMDCCGLTTNFLPVSPICQNIPFAFPTTSHNGISGSWSPVFSSTNLGTTTYTFTPDNPCYQSATMTITIVTCGNCDNAPGLQLSGEISGILAPGEYRIVGDIEIQVSAILNDCVFAIDPNKSITVSENANLFVFNSHFYGCHTLWNGIDVKENGRLRMTSSLIEDAKVAINMQEITQQTNSERLVVSEVIFNKNITGLKINGYPFENPNTVFNLYGNVFTSRVITTDPTTWPSAAVVNSPNLAANNSNFVNPRVNPSTYPETGPLLNMLNNGSLTSGGTGSLTGIALYNIGIMQTNLANVFTIGRTTDMDSYLFDRMTHGIYVYRSVLNINHAYFQATHHNIVNYGVFADGASSSINFFNGSIQIDGQTTPVQFYNLHSAINVKDYTQLTVRHARIRSNRNSTISSNGQVGVQYYSNLTQKFHVVFNEISNINSGIYTQIGRSGTLTILDFDISSNNIRRSIPNGSAGVVFNSGIYVGNNPGSNSGFFVPTQNPFKIRNNQIQGVRRAIYIGGLAASNIRIEGNNIMVSENIGAPWQPNAQYWGIYLRGVTEFGAISGASSTITDNYVVGFNSVNTQARGIMVNNTPSFLIRCNNTRAIGAGLYFSGNSPSRVRQNNMFLNRYGFWLDNGANIGAQGSVGFPAENTWENGGSNNTNWSLYTGLTPIDLNIRLKTYVSNATAIGQPMYVRNLATHNPDNSWGRNDILWIPINSSFNTLIQTNGNWPKSCLATYLEEPEEIDLEEVFAFNEKLLALESMSVQLDTSQLEAPWDIINEHETYEEIKRNPELRDSSEVLDNYYVQREMENLGKLREAEDKIDEKDYVAAAAIRDGIVPDNLVELAHRSVISLTLKYEMGDFQTSDSLDLVDWAESCGYIYGVAVSKAQILYNYIYRSTEIFNEICPETVLRSVLIASGDKKEVTLSLYPNPTGGMLYIQCSDPELRQGICEIYSLDGRVVYKGNIHFLRGLNLENLNLSSGAYVIEIEVPNKSLFFKEKFIYNK